MCDIVFLIFTVLGARDCLERQGHCDVCINDTSEDPMGWAECACPDGFLFKTDRTCEGEIPQGLWSILSEANCCVREIHK